MRSPSQPRSLIARILLAELGTILIFAVLLPAIMIGLLRQQTSRYETQTLSEQAREIARGLTPARGAITLAPDLAQTYATPYDGRAYAIADQAGTRLAESAFAAQIPWPRVPRAPVPRSFRIGTIVGFSQPILAGERKLWVVVTQDEGGRGAILDDVARAFVTRYAPVLLLILLLLPLINSLFIRRFVVAVRAVSAEAGQIGAESLDRRLDETGLPLEVAPLARATNALLVRLQQSFQQQSEFVANVAHELRTPLAAVKLGIEAVEPAEARARLGSAVDRLGHVVAQLQALAALEIGPTAFAGFDAAELAREVIAELAPQIFASGDTIDLEAPDQAVILFANRTLIALALSNLILNATRHTPPGTTIDVRIARDGLIAVRDDGPGIASSDPTVARRRYWRADNLRSDSAGLGLSIVARIMEVHGGELAIHNIEGGGADVALRLPRPAHGPDAG